MSECRGIRIFCPKRRARDTPNFFTHTTTPRVLGSQWSKCHRCRCEWDADGASAACMLHGGQTAWALGYFVHVQTVSCVGYLLDLCSIPLHSLLYSGACSAPVFRPLFSDTLRINIYSCHSHEGTLFVLTSLFQSYLHPNFQEYECFVRGAPYCVHQGVVQR